MALIVKNWNCLLIVALTGQAYDIANGIIGLNKVAIFRDTTFMEESFRSFLFGAVVIDDESQSRN